MAKCHRKPGTSDDCIFSVLEIFIWNADETDRGEAIDDAVEKLANISILYGDVRFLKALLDAGACLEPKNFQGLPVRTVLRVAVEQNNGKCVEALVAAEYYDYECSDGKTALIYAAEEGYVECVKALTTQHNKAPRYSSDDIVYAMLCVIGEDRERERTECVEYFLKIVDIDFYEGDYFCQTALMRAAQLGCEECVKMLLAAGADKSIEDDCGWTALMHAAYWGNMGCMKLLLYLDADYGFDALKTAIFRDHVECVEALLAAGADKDREDDDGWTALMYADFWGKKKCVKALLDAGADEETLKRIK
jgi:uncharacterized protein